MILRDYQTKLYADTRAAIASTPRVCVQLPPGGGKTVLASTMTKSAIARGKRVWIIVPRGEIGNQFSKTLKKMNQPHGRIDAKHSESAAFRVHIVSSHTLIKRWDKIVNAPDLIFIDEAHLFHDRQLKILEHYPSAYVIGLTATPERLDGKPLRDIYGALVEGPPKTELIKKGALVPPILYAPELEGLGAIKRSGLDYEEKALANLLEKRCTYGNAVEKYMKHAQGRTALVFARSVNEAGKVAAEFRNVGLRFETISAKTKTDDRATLIKALENHELDGLVNCEIATYGLDVPTLGCVILLRPTKSKALQEQMIWRGGRAHAESGKKDFIILDHVNMYLEFGHPLKNNEWNFNGTVKRKKTDKEALKFKLCPETGLYCERASCVGCEHNTKQRKSRASEIIDCELKKIECDIDIKKAPADLRREIKERLDAAIRAAKESNLAPGPVGEALKAARLAGKPVMWVYHVLNSNKHLVNATLLHEIARQLGYKPGWAWMKRKELENKK